MNSPVMLNTFEEIARKQDVVSRGEGEKYVTVS